MTSIPSIVDQAEGFLRERALELTRPHENECLCCYVARMLDEFPCDGSHRHAFRYRDTVAPRATALATRLRQVGACCCDCELLMNGYRPRADLQEYMDDGMQDDDVEPALDELPPCEGVRRGSVQPCQNWVQIHRR